MKKNTKLIVGECSRKQYVIDYEEYPHILICGQSGQGKTLLMSDLKRQFEKAGATAYVVDKYGGLSFGGLALTEKKSFESLLEMLCDEASNRMRILSEDEECGGDFNVYSRSFRKKTLSRIVILCDGLDLFIEEEDEELTGLLSTLLKIGYKTGIHFIISSNTASLPDDIIQNIDLRICMNVKRTKDSEMLLGGDPIATTLARGTLYAYKADKDELSDRICIPIACERFDLTTIEWNDDLTRENIDDTEGFIINLGAGERGSVMVDLDRHQNLLITGDEGCGKSELVSCIARQCSLNGARVYQNDTSILYALIQEAEERKLLFEENSAKNFSDYNSKTTELLSSLEYKRLLRIIAVFDSCMDAETSALIEKLLSVSDGTGIHCIITTSRPSVIADEIKSDTFHICGRTQDIREALLQEVCTLDEDSKGVFFMAFPGEEPVVFKGYLNIKRIPVERGRTIII